MIMSGLQSALGQDDFPKRASSSDTAPPAPRTVPRLAELRYRVAVRLALGLVLVALSLAVDMSRSSVTALVLADLALFSSVVVEGLLVLKGT